jgi:serine/threonine protein kinase
MGAMEIPVLSHYTPLEPLGGGGMGIVYKAEDIRLKRPVALKFLPSALTRDEDARQRFVQEAQAASALDHPNIGTIYEIDSTPDGQLFIAMAYYDGETLKQRLARGPLGIDDAVDVVRQIARGLIKAHAAGIVHRDIKPANLIVTRDGLVKIVDFGIAKLMGQTGVTRTGTTVGTVAYMAPEQIDGAGVDQQADLGRSAWCSTKCSRAIARLLATTTPPSSTASSTRSRNRCACGGRTSRRRSTRPCVAC